MAISRFLAAPYGTVRTRFNLAVADFYAGELDSATRGLVDAAAASKRLLGPDHIH